MNLRALVPISAAMSLAACSPSNNLVLGRVQADVGGHAVVVTDCYRVKPPQPLAFTTGGGPTTYRYVPCKDAEITIMDDNLTVNGRAHGKLKPKDRVVVDHGRVSIQSQSADRTLRSY